MLRATMLRASVFVEVGLYNERYLAEDVIAR